MTAKPLSGRTIAIILANGFDEIEFVEPQKKLIEAGAVTKVASRSNGLVNGWFENGWGHFFTVDMGMAETLAVDFDGLVLPGGFRAVQKLLEDPHAKRIVKAFIRADMPVFVVGDAVQMLALTEMVEGRTLTSSETARSALEEAGAKWEEAAFSVDGNIVTVAGPAGVGEAVEQFITLVADYQDEDAQAA
jgi:protease I